ncbi:MAG: FtsW/RodA/SpoVE family cell cycle protein [Patescibacteria group bacterium]
MFFLSSVRKFDWWLLMGVALIAAMSLVSLFSFEREFFLRQALWYLLFFIIVFLGSQVHWRFLVGQAWFRQIFYWCSVALLILPMFQSGSVRGTKSWLTLGAFRFQPSEFMKIALILLLAGFFSRMHVQAWLGKNIVISFFYAALPAFLVMLQPDLGSALVLLGIWCGFLFMSGFHLRRVLLLFSIFFMGALFAWLFLLQPYQKERLSSFLFPERDPLGASYNVNQAKIAVGSAGFWGKGFGLGTQTHLRFLPEAATDFLFSAYVEEWGIFGGILLLLTFSFVVFRITSIGYRSRNNYYRFIALGFALLLLIHFFVNAGSNLGLTPVTGIPFPFLSYGGSHLLTLAILVGIIERVTIESS